LAHHAPRLFSVFYSTFLHEVEHTKRWDVVFVQYIKTTGTRNDILLFLKQKTKSTSISFCYLVVENICRPETHHRMLGGEKMRFFF
jgi:hypothetical protein